MKAKRSLKIHIASVYHVEGSGFKDQHASTLVSWVLPSEKFINVGIAPRRSKRVWIFTADFVERNKAQGKNSCTSRWRWSPRHRPCSSDPTASLLRYRFCAPFGSRLQQDRPRFSSSCARWYRSKYFYCSGSKTPCHNVSSGSLRGLSRYLAGTLARPTA